MKMGKAVILFVLLPIISLSIFPLVEGTERAELSERRDPNEIPHRIEFGTTDALGGGSYLRMDIEGGASFMVLWGDRENPAPVTIISHGVDVVGLERSGNGSAHPITSNTLIFYRIEAIKEFQDLNGNGLHDHSKGREEVSAVRPEPVDKGCSLKAVWKVDKQRPYIKDGILHWEFTLHAWNISYRSLESQNTDRVNSTRPKKVMFLDKISLDFSVKVTKKLARMTFKQYPIINSDSPNQDADPAILDEVGKSTRTTSSSVKHGLLIEGWDFEEKSTNPSLGVLFSLKFLRTMDSGPRAAAVEPAIESVFGKYGLFEKAGGPNSSVLWKEGEDIDPNKRDFSKVDGRFFFGKSQDEKLGFSWIGQISDKIYSEKSFANLQLLGMEKIEPGDPIWNNPLFKGRNGMGVSMNCAFIYPAARVIYHDPELTVTSIETLKDVDDVVMDDDDIIDGPGNLSTIESISILLIIMVIILMIIVVIIVSLTRRRYDPEDEEWMREEEEEVFIVRTRKKDWDRLRPK